jgi:hypothetical protein
MGRGIVMQQESNALCSKLWPQPRNALIQSSDNLNVESTTDCVPFRHKFVINYNLFFKKLDQHGFDLGHLQTKLLGIGDDFKVHCML